MRRGTSPNHAWAPARGRFGVRKATAALAALALAVAVPAAAAFGDENISSDNGPLTNIRITPDLNCAVNHTDDSSGEWFGDTACGTFVAVGGTLYGPADVPAGGGATGVEGYTPYTYTTNPTTGAATNQRMSGSGAARDPYVIKTRVTLGESGLTLTETDTYQVGQESYQTDVRLTNAESEPQTPIIYRGGDCYLQGDDHGLGSLQNGDSPICQALPDSDAPDRIEGMYPLTSGSHYIEGQYSCMWRAIGAETDLPDGIGVTANNDAGTCQPGDTNEHDNGLALSWTKRIAAQATTTVSALTVFSPTGASPLVFDKTADQDSATAGSSDGYTITVTNNANFAQTLNTITDTLPDGFTYTPDSSSGATSDDPTTDGQNITWTGPFRVPGADGDDPGSISLHFGVAVADAEGTFTNSVTGAGRGVSVIAATDVAPIDVTQSDGPVAGDDSYNTACAAPLTVDAPGLLQNDSDPRGAPVSVDLDTVTTPGNGSVSVNSDGSFTYTPAAAACGTTDTFTYEATAGERDSAPATVSIVVAANQPPNATADAYTTPEDQRLTVSAADGVLANDTDPDTPKKALSASLVSGSGPSHGSLTLGPRGGFAYTPAANYNGTDSFQYRASDGSLSSDPVTVTINVTPVDDGIQAVDDAYTAIEDQTLSVTSFAAGVLGNDVNVDDNTLTASLVAGPSHGTLHLDADGTFTYTPDPGRMSDSFTYRASNSLGETSNVATVRIDVQAVDHAPVGNADSYSTNEDTPLSTGGDTGNPGVLDNDTDPDGDTLAAIIVSPPDPAAGTLTLDPNGNFTFVPAANFNGTATFQYRATDGSLTSSPTTVTITVVPVNDRPVANGDSYTTNRDTTLHVDPPGVLGNDTDVDHDALTATLVDSPAPAHGTVTLNGDGSFRYVPDAGYVGSDSFAYIASDSHGEDSMSSAPATVSITVLPVNHAPTAADNSYRTPKNVTLRVARPGILGNDGDPDDVGGIKTALTTVLASSPSHGSLHLGPNGGFVYVPRHDFVGTDSFRYRASDGLLSSASALVTIRVFGSVTTTPPPPPSSPPASAAPSTPTSAGPTTVPPPGEPTASGTVAPTAPTAPTTETPTTETPTTAPPSTTSPSGPRVVTRVPNGLKLSAPSINPGGSITASGSGCESGSTVTLAIDGKAAGRGTADSKGDFDVPVSAPRLDIGKHTIVATCGDRQLTAPVAFVSVTGASAAPGARALTVGAVFAFFLLFLGLALRRPNSGK